MTASAAEEFPEELTDTVSTFQSSLARLRNTLEVGQQQSRADLELQLDPIGRASIDLVSAYAINSLFWMLLKTQVCPGLVSLVNSYTVNHWTGREPGRGGCQEAVGQGEGSHAALQGDQGASQAAQA